MLTRKLAADSGYTAYAAQVCDVRKCLRECVCLRMLLVYTYAQHSAVLIRAKACWLGRRTCARKTLVMIKHTQKKKHTQHTYNHVGNVMRTRGGSRIVPLLAVMLAAIMANMRLQLDARERVSLCIIS